MMGKKIKSFFTIDEELYNIFENYVNNSSISRSKIISKLIEDYLKNNENTMENEKMSTIEKAEKSFIDKSKAIRKWKPILDSLEVTSKNKIELMSIFAEKYQIRHNQEDIFHMEANLLLVSMKIFSELNIDDKIVLFDDLDDEYLKDQKLECDLSVVSEIEKHGGNPIIKLEDVIIEKTIEMINNDLQNCEIIVIEELAKDMTLLTPNREKGELVLTSKYKTINKKLIL